MYILWLEGKNRYSLFVAGIVVVGRIFKAKKSKTYASHNKNKKCYF